MRVSWGTPRRARVSAAWRMVSQSDWLPMTMPTSAGGTGSLLRPIPLLRSVVKGLSLLGRPRGRGAVARGRRNYREGNVAFKQHRRAPSRPLEPPPAAAACSSKGEDVHFSVTDCINLCLMRPGHFRGLLCRVDGVPRWGNPTTAAAPQKDHRLRTEKSPRPAHVVMMTIK